MKIHPDVCPGDNSTLHQAGDEDEQRNKGNSDWKVLYAVMNPGSL